MSYICCVDAACPEPVFLERKETEQLVHQFGDRFHPALTPGPNLRGYKIINGNTTPFHLACDAEMKVRAIGQQGGCRGVVGGVAAKPPVFAIDARQVTDHLGEAYDGQTCRIDNRLHPGCLKLRPGAAVETQARQAASERGDDAGCVQIT
jgi:hypothetical protein